jgi:hypothetical protein
MPLPAALRARLELATGGDLGGVRVHDDSTAASMASHLRADACTVGRNIFFATGRFQPQTRPGLALLVHELTHVSQQPGGQPFAANRLTATHHHALEQEAHDHARAALTGASLPLMNFGGRAGASLPAASGSPLQFTAPRDGGGSFTPLLLAYGTRPAAAVVPMRQEAGTSPSSGSVASTPAAPKAPSADPEKMGREMFDWLQRRLRREAERKGVQLWV